MTVRTVRVWVLLSSFVSLSSCLPLPGDDSGSSYQPSPPECSVDSDCAGQDTDDDRCTIARCQYDQCEVVSADQDPSCECWDDSECESSTCSEATCDDHLCVVTLFPAGPAPEQVNGDCAEVVCDGDSPDARVEASISDVPSQAAGDCQVLSCDGIAAEPISTADPADLPTDKECNTGYCSDFGPEWTPLADGTACAAAAGFCFSGTCLTTCQPSNASSCGAEGIAEPANDSGTTPAQFTGSPGACGFLDDSDVDWYTFYAEDEDFETDILWVHAWSSAATLEVCVHVSCTDGSNPGGGCGSKVAGPNGSLGCCWTGASQGFAQSWDLDCGSNEDSGTVYVSVRAPGGDACDTYAVEMYY